MAYDFFLILHLAGAALTGVVVCGALYALWHRSAATYRTWAFTLGVLAGAEIASGTALSIISIKLSAATVCSRLFMYLLVISLIETVLFIRIRKTSIPLPVGALSPVVAGLALLFAAFAAGY